MEEEEGEGRPPSLLGEVLNWEELAGRIVGAWAVSWEGFRGEQSFLVLEFGQRHPDNTCV